MDSGAQIIGVNNRNLHTFEVDMSTTGRLRPLLPHSTIVAALSGIRSLEDARRMRDAGADAPASAAASASSWFVIPQIFTII